MLRRLLPALVAAALAAPAAAAGAVRTSIFYYPCDGTPEHDGSFIHWQQNGAAPPSHIASSFYPARGPYSSTDLVVLGAEWGHGRRQGWLSNLHLGARDPKTGVFVMVGKCFKGLTDELLIVLIPVAAITALGHLAAILASDRLQ